VKILENTRELFQMMTRRFGFLNKNCCSVGSVEISVVHSHILYEIDKNKNPSIQQVAETLGIDITTFSRQVQSLVKQGLVKKTPDPSDRRVSILSLTTEGKFIASAIDSQMKQYLEQVFSHLNEFEKETIIRSMELLSSAMEKTTYCCQPFL
jgi:DNA-binding MarR family transcriptional regulator